MNSLTWSAGKAPGTKEHSMSEKQNRKRTRTKMYFIEAAKEMIESRGVESVSVRNIADAAGFSYPTLYNYFNDLNELLWETKGFMILELVETMRQKMSYQAEDMEEVKRGFKAYIQYYLDHPNIFKFFYQYPLQKPEGKSEDSPTEPDYGAMWTESFQGIVRSGRLAQKDIEAAAKTLIYAIHGMLMLSFSNNGDLSEAANLYRDLDQIVGYLL
jgi:AcrR family transcriptional regulator